MTDPSPFPGEEAPSEVALGAPDASSVEGALADQAGAGTVADQAGAGTLAEEALHTQPTPGPAFGAPPIPTPDFKMAIVASVTIDLPSQHPMVVLRETESPRRQLTFMVGFHDGIALSHALRRIPTPRPLTHELITDILQGFDIDVVAVRLVGRVGNTYFAELDLRGRHGRSVFSCRPSDAVTFAIRQPVPVPILIDARLFEVLGDLPPPGIAR